MNENKLLKDYYNISYCILRQSFISFFWVGPLFLSALFIFLTPARASYQLQDQDYYQRALKLLLVLKDEKVTNELANIKIAILDNGFGEIDKDPAKVSQYFKNTSATYVQFEETPNNKVENQDDHGLRMAQIVAGITNNNAPLFLINTNKFSNFRKAVQYCADNKINIILFSQNYSFGSNFNGQGFVNDIVEIATSKGIIWINAAGNNQNLIYSFPWMGKDDVGNIFLFPEDKKNRSIYLDFFNSVDNNTVQIDLSWTDKSNLNRNGVEKDIDLYLVNRDTNEIIEKSELKQVAFPSDTRTDKSIRNFPFERIKFQIDRGNYGALLKWKYGDFIQEDEIRFVITSSKQNGISLNKNRSLNGTSDGSISPLKHIIRQALVPSDSATVISVGDFSRYSNGMTETLDGRSKPDVILPSLEFNFTDGISAKGTTGAAAMAASATAVLLAIHRVNLQNYENDENYNSRLNVIRREEVISSLKCIASQNDEIRDTRSCYRFIIDDDSRFTLNRRRGTEYQPESSPHLVASPSRNSPSNPYSSSSTSAGTSNFQFKPLSSGRYVTTPSPSFPPKKQGGEGGMLLTPQPFSRTNY